MDVALTNTENPRERLREIKEAYGIDLIKVVGQLELLTGYLMESVAAPPLSAPPVSDPGDIIPELTALLVTIRETKSEISLFNPSDVKTEFIPQATDELDAIVEATATATNTIMDSAEQVEEAANRAADKIRDGGDAAACAAALQAEQADAVMQVFEACSFQDITGQRITKVIKVIQDIEQRVDRLTAMFGDGEHVPVVETDGDGVKNAESEPSPGELGHELANGPQLPNDAASQEDIDALLASFD